MSVRDNDIKAGIFPGEVIIVENGKMPLNAKKAGPRLALPGTLG